MRPMMFSDCFHPVYSGLFGEIMPCFACLSLRMMWVRIFFKLLDLRVGGIFSYCSVGFLRICNGANVLARRISLWEGKLVFMFKDFSFESLADYERDSHTQFYFFYPAENNCNCKATF
jgi:hypothetical protein